MRSDAEVAAARQLVVETARAMLDGRLSFIEGARRINGQKWHVDLPDPELDPDMVCFLLIDSETDILPLGDVRQLWQPAALEKLQPKIEQSEQWARETGRAACQSLIKRFSGNAQSPVAPEQD
jgi:hypothetical protein